MDSGVDAARPGTPATTSSPVQDGDWNLCQDAGANDTYGCGMTPALGAYVVGMQVNFEANTINTGAATLNIDSLGAITIVKLHGGITTTLANGDICAGQHTVLHYDGTNFQMQGQICNVGSSDGVGYDEVLEEASGLTKRAQVNFIGSRITCVDDAGNTRTNCTVVLTANDLISTIGITIDGGGSAITTGQKGYIEVPFACTISRATTLADQSGSIVIDVWKDTYANYPPVDADSITASAPPYPTPSELPDARSNL